MVELENCHIRRHCERDSVKNFSCGDIDLDDFLKNDSLIYDSHRLSSCYLLEKDCEVQAYFSIANDRVSIEDFDDRSSFNRFRRKRFNNSKRIKGYPAVKICRLAVSLTAQGNHIGSNIIDYIKGMLIRKSRSACRFLLVDAYRDAIPFYRKNGFEFLNPFTESTGDTVLMYYDLFEYRG